jgi:hypothetical protein
MHRSCPNCSPLRTAAVGTTLAAHRACTRVLRFSQQAKTLGRFFSQTGIFALLDSHCTSRGFRLASQRILLKGFLAFLLHWSMSCRTWMWQAATSLMIFCLQVAMPLCTLFLQLSMPEWMRLLQSAGARATTVSVSAVGPLNLYDLVRKGADLRPP